MIRNTLSSSSPENRKGLAAVAKVVMYMREGEVETEREPWLDFTTATAAVATVVLSFLPAALFAMASGAMLKLF